MPTPFAPRDDTTVILDRTLPVIAFVLTIAALISAEHRSIERHFVGPVDTWAWALAPVLGGLLLARKAAPTVTLVLSAAAVIAYYASGQPAIGLELPLAAAFFSAAERGRTRASVITAVVLLVIAYGYRVVIAETRFISLLGLDLMTSVVLLALAIAAGDGIRSRAAERAASLERSRLQAELVEENLRAATDVERRELARDVHDVLGHAMVVVSTQANVALESLDDPASLRTCLGNIKATSQQALRDIRGSVAVLSGGEERARRPVATVDDLDELAARFEGTGLEILVLRDPALGPLPATVGSTAYRIVQEAVTNAVRHGAARQVTVSLDRVGESLEVEVGDDGRGAGEFTMGHGLRGMHDRVSMLGGEVHAGPGASGGFTVLARIPLGPSGGQRR